MPTKASRRSRSDIIDDVQGVHTTAELARLACQSKNDVALIIIGDDVRSCAKEAAEECYRASVDWDGEGSALFMDACADLLGVVGIELLHRPEGRPEMFGTIPVSVLIDCMYSLAARAAKIVEELQDG